MANEKDTASAAAPAVAENFGEMKTPNPLVRERPVDPFAGKAEQIDGSLGLYTNVGDVADVGADVYEAAPDPQLEAARRVGNTWTLDGQEYAKFVANRTANVAIPIVRDEKTVAILGAEFMWEDDKPFLDHLDINRRDIVNPRTRETRVARGNLTQHSAVLFEETVQRGWLEKIDEFGERGPRVEKDRTAMLAYAPEIQADLINAWLGKVVVKRYFPPGHDDIDDLLQQPTEIFLKVSIGDYERPAHVVLLRCNVPNAEARRNYEDSTFFQDQKQEGDKVVNTYIQNNKAKLNFFRKYLAGVDGAVLAPEGELDLDTDTFRAITDEHSVKQFGKMFCPNWEFSCADALADCFNFGGK